MPKSTESLNNSLFELLRSKGYDPTMMDTSGKEIPVPDDAEVFQFNFVKDDVDYGKVTISIDGLQKLTIYYGDNVANSDKGSEEDSKDTNWYRLLKHLKRFAKKRQLGFVLKNSSHLKHDMAKRDYMKKKEKISEGYYPLGKKTSYSDAIPTVKIVIEHSRQMELDEARFRSINRIFLENQLGERFLLDTKKPGIARVYARHIAEGGRVNDQRWEHIKTLSEEYNKMSGFVRAVRNNQFNESAQVLVNEGIQHYQKLRETLSKMSGHRGYNVYFESWTPALMEDEIETNNLNELFVQETLDPRIESVMPILSKLHKKVSEMKEINQLEEWADSLLEYDEENLDEEEVEEEISVGGVSTKTDTSGNTTQSYSAGPLNAYTTKNPQGQTVKSGSAMDIGGANIKADTEYSGGQKGITTMTGTAKDAFGQQTVDQVLGVQGAANRKGVDPTKFAQFQKNLPTNESMDNIDSFERNQSSKSDSKQTNKPVVGTIKGGVWTADPPKKGEKGVPVPTPVDEELDESGLQAYLGNKKYGKKGMDALRKAGREHASKEKMAQIRAKYDKIDEQGVVEGFNSDLEMELYKLTKSSDMYDAIYNALGRNDNVGMHLQDMMYDVARENRLHPDDDIEQIIDMIADRLEDDYGDPDINENQGVAEGSLNENQEWDVYTVVQGNRAELKGSIIAPDENAAIQAVYKDPRTYGYVSRAYAWVPFVKPKGASLPPDIGIIYQKIVNSNLPTNTKNMLTSMITGNHPGGKDSPEQYYKTGKFSPKVQQYIDKISQQGVAEGYDEDEGNPVMNAITSRIMRTRPDLLGHDLRKLQAAIRDVALDVGDVDEIGSSDISGWVKRVEQQLSGKNMAEGSLEEVSLDLAKRARDKAEYYVNWDEDDMRDRPEGYSEKQRSKFQRYIDRKEPRAKGDRDWDPPNKGLAAGSQDKTVKIVKRRGKPIGEIGVDPEASPGNGSYYVKLYDGSVDLSGYDTAEEALAELKYLVKQSEKENSVNETEKTQSSSDYGKETSSDSHPTNSKPIPVKPGTTPEKAKLDPRYQTDPEFKKEVDTAMKIGVKEGQEDLDAILRIIRK